MPLAEPPSVPSRFDATSTTAQVLEGIDLTGRTAIVTGATSGVGAATARALAGAGADVVMAVRDVGAGQAVADEIGAEMGRSPTVSELDLLRLASVRAFARRFGDRPLHILINNAGLMAPPFEITEDGFESQMAVNFFSPFLLSKLLAPNMIAAAPARMVMVSSGSHHKADIDFDDLAYVKRPYDKFFGYGLAKTAANLLAVGFNRRFAKKGVTANAVTPSAVVSKLGRHATFEDAVALGWIRPDGTVPDMEFKTPDQGAATSIWAAVAPELAGIGGLYFEDCQVAPEWSPEKPLKGVMSHSMDPQKADRLWAAAEQMVERTTERA